MRARKKFLWRRALVVFVIACSGAVVWDLGARVVAIAGAEPSPAGQRVYVVRPGDTIWSIATRSARGGDPWRMVNRLETEVGGGVLQPGERLVLP
jgi:LysM domain